ncbi:hypothetical protein CCACVL1_11063 [Corchorus capsularis]|uniref:Uncharacterized protein n=1 Tax=Corchorus capsularis TaxID=210143 RepID=A0A1R3IN41_COCAP|nr:hypothetical protein CCACVL1_11063 [Corchorus capsularis]
MATPIFMQWNFLSKSSCSYRCREAHKNIRRLEKKSLINSMQPISKVDLKDSEKEIAFSSTSFFDEFFKKTLAFHVESRAYPLVRLDGPDAILNKIVIREETPPPTPSSSFNTTKAQAKK